VGVGKVAAAMVAIGLCVTACGGDNGGTTKATVHATTARKALPTVARTTTTAARTKPRAYIVKPGDSLSRIAKQFGVTVAAIATANGIKDPDMIVAGQRLRIPAATTSTTR
jgi:LysM repeat protein